MFTRRNVIISVLTVIIISFGQNARCQICDIDFHLESSSVMLLEGENASLLCDATCYGEQINVFWRDSRGTQIGNHPGRIFSVRYNRGLMNRLMIIGARLDTSGDYICYVMRNGEILQQNHLNVLVLGSQGEPNYIPRQNTGPRRGDITPRREIEYRPVRSVNRALSHLGKLHFSKDNSVHQGVQLDTAKRANKHREDVAAAETDVPFLKKLVKRKQYQTRDLHQFPSGGAFATNNDKGAMIKTTKNKNEVVQTLGNNKIARRKSFKPSIRIGKLNSDLKRTNNIPKTQQVNKKDTTNLDSRNKRCIIGNQSDVARIKRQVTSTTSTSDLEKDTTNTAETAANDLSNTTIDNSTPVEQDVRTSSPNNSSEDAASDTTTIIPRDLSETTKKIKADENGVQEQKDTTQCPLGPQEQSNFGKYGVLAFAVSLAVAFLLFYSILMIIFMPRMLARRRNKEIVEGATYRKTGPDTSDTAPLTMLDSAGKADDDTNQGQQETIDVDKSASQSDQAETVKKDDDNKEISTNVSSFLIRQESQKKTQEEAKSESSGDKPSQTTSLPSSDTNQTNSLKAPTEKDAAAEVKVTQQSDDLLSSLLPELGLTSSAFPTSQNQLEINPSPDSKSEANKTPINSGHNPSNPGAFDSDLPPPPPPPPESNDALHDPVMIV